MERPDNVSSFPSTQWTRLIEPLQDGAPDSTEALNRLFEIYRPPILQFFIRRGVDVHQAEDLAQDFVASLLRNRIWEDVDRARGLFRCFLATRLRWFLQNHRSRSKAPHDSLDEMAENPPDAAVAQDAEFDRAWAWALIRQVLARLKDDWARRGRGIRFEDLSGFLTTEADEPSVAALSVKYDKNPNAIYQAVSQLRRTYASLIVESVERTVSSPDEVKAEIAYLMAQLK